MRALMTDVVQIYRAPNTTTGLGEVVRKFSLATLLATGYGSLQLYFSAEYDVDRDTLQRLGRVITDDPGLYVVDWTDWVTVNGVTYEVDGHPQKWTLRGLHHAEFNIKKLEG